MTGEKPVAKKGKGTQVLEGHVSGQSNEPLSRPAHALTYGQVVEQLASDANDGISGEEAKRRLEQYGKNDIGDSEAISPVKIMVAQVANAMTLVSCAQTPALALLFCRHFSESRRDKVNADWYTCG